MERRSSQIEELNSIPLYPTEEVIWDENLGIKHFLRNFINPLFYLEFQTDYTSFIKFSIS